MHLDKVSWLHQEHLGILGSGLLLLAISSAQSHLSLGRLVAVDLGEKLVLSWLRKLVESLIFDAVLDLLSSTHQHGLCIILSLLALCI